MAAELLDNGLISDEFEKRGTAMMIRIVFEFETKYGVFRDALYLPEDHGLTDEQIAGMQRERVNNWLAVVEAPPAEEPVSDA